MKKALIALFALMLLSGCVETDTSMRQGVYGKSNCNTLLVKPNSSFTITGILHSIDGMNNYLFGQEAKRIHVGNKTHYPYVIEVESINNYIGLNVTLNCDYIYYDDECGKTDYHVRIKFPIIVEEMK